MNQMKRDYIHMYKEEKPSTIKDLLCAAFYATLLAIAILFSF